jgi:hypothetical protein
MFLWFLVGIIHELKRNKRTNLKTELIKIAGDNR